MHQTRDASWTQEPLFDKTTCLCFAAELVR